MTVLRPYQSAAVARIRAEFGSGKKGVVAVSPVASGKTVIMSEIIRLAVSKGRRALVLVHRQELIRQTVEKLRNVGFKNVDIISAAIGEECKEAMVSVASTQTLWSRGITPECQLLVADELHHYVSSAWIKIADEYKSTWRLGFTATPERADGKGLAEGGWDSLVEITTPSELTKLGFLCPCDVYAPSKRLRGAVVDPVEAYEKHGRGKPTILFARSVEQARELAQRLGGECVDGATPGDIRFDVLDRFKSGQLDLLTNCFVLTEGTDLPRAQVCIVARGCTSAGTWLQMIGRVMRLHPGKERAVVVDLTGACHEHGLPADERKWSLEGKAHQLLVDKKKEKLKQCPKCGAMTRDPVCPSCGHVFPKPRPPRVVRENLRHITYVDPDDATMVKRRRDYDFFMYQAKTKGYKPGWAAYRYKNKHGEWPPREWLRAFESSEYDESDYGSVEGE